MTKVLIIFLLAIFFALPLFAQSVDTAWVRKLAYLDNSISQKVVIDDSNNVYVTGYISFGVPYSIYMTVKYYPNGDTGWVRTYSGPVKQDKPKDIAIDKYGNVDVTGYISEDSFSNNGDYATIKYYTNGDTAWARRYNGLGNGDDKASALAIDASGNVYVTGWSFDSGTGLDYATIKYHPNGDTAWVRKYNGPGNGTDLARALAIDGSGNVYVTGNSFGTGTYYDYATIKYYPNGDTAWVRRYSASTVSDDDPTAIAADSLGNIYVTGITDLPYNYNLTVKYYPNGDTAWTRICKEPNERGQTYAIAMDRTGNVYVTGGSFGSGSVMDYLTIKYYPTGDTAWLRRYNGPGNRRDYASDIAVDGSGNIYVTGYSWGGDEYESWDDYATLKYDSSGNQLWLKRYARPEGGSDLAFSLAIDGSGSVYVTGISSGTVWEYLTIKYVQFLRGDANQDKKVTIADIVYLVSYLFKFGPSPNPIQSGDANCDGKVTIADVVYLVSYLFKHGTVPCI